MSRDLPLVVGSGLCVGCGACAAVAPDELTMRLNETGTYLPEARPGRTLTDFDGATADLVSSVCPFSGDARNEDSIAESLYGGSPDVLHHGVTGYYRRIVAGHVASAGFREGGTSGGMTSWLLHELMRTGEVDGVLHVASAPGGGPGALSQYRISRTVEELLAGRKSRYHVQTLDQVLAQVREEPGRYAVVGVPCFIKAVRLLADADEVLRERIVFTASLVCGHMKSTLYSDYLAWSVGIRPELTLDIDYRHKEPGRPPNRYSVRVTSRDGQDVVRGNEEIPLADWGLGIFKLGACDYCDDIVGETADVSLGDAWLPPFMSDWQGANLAIARSEQAARILDAGQASGALAVIPWTAEDVAAAQAGAVRHRRSGLAVRLANRARQGRWAPTKRVDPVPSSELGSVFAQRMLNREAIAEASTAAYLEANEVGDLDIFRRRMRPLVRRYDGGRLTTGWRRAAARVVRKLPPKGEELVRRATGGARFS